MHSLRFQVDVYSETFSSQVKQGPCSTSSADGSAIFHELKRINSLVFSLIPEIGSTVLFHQSSVSAHQQIAARTAKGYSQSQLSERFLVETYWVHSLSALIVIPSAKCTHNQQQTLSSTINNDIISRSSMLCVYLSVREHTHNIIIQK
jgi:hypothetical protein